jgi:predicted MFS family arabinose efflux permease
LLLAAFFLSVGPHFLLAPNLPTVLLENEHLSESTFTLYYLASGIVALAVTPFAGRAVDAGRGTLVIAVATGLWAAAAIAWLLVEIPHGSLAWFVLIGAGNAARLTACYALLLRVGDAQDRAALMSLCTAAQYVAVGLASIAAPLLLVEAPSGALVGMGLVAVIASVISALAVWLVAAARRRERQESVSITPAGGGNV